MTTRYSGPADPVLRQTWRSERRAVLLAHHPDRGGDAALLDSELRRVDERYRSEGPPGTTYAAPGRLQPLTRRLRRTARGVRRSTRAVRARLPPGWPGSRRYLDL